MARKTQHRKLRMKYAVLGDGRTEQLYLQHLKTLYNYGYSVKPSLFANITLFRASEIIDELLDGGCDRIVFLTDYDTVVNQQKKGEFDDLVKKYSECPQVLICESMPSIEFWFLLHFQFTTKEFRNAKEVEEALKKYIPDYSKEQRSFLCNGDWVKFLCSDSKKEFANKNAGKILAQKESENMGSHFPFTKLHIAISEFEKLKKGKA